MLQTEESVTPLSKDYERSLHEGAPGPDCDRSHSDGHALLTRPSINRRGELIIPFDSDRRYHYWAGGQSVAATLQELNAPREVWARYTEAPYGQGQ